MTGAQSRERVEMIQTAGSKAGPPGYPPDAVNRALVVR